MSLLLDDYVLLTSVPNTSSHLQVSVEMGDKSW